MLENSVLQSCVLAINRLAQKHNSLLFTNHLQISFSTNFPVNKIRRPVNNGNIEGFLAKKILYLGVCSLNGDSELSPLFDNLLLAIGFILFKKIRKSGKSENAILLIDLEFIDQFEFWTTRFFDILQNWWVSAAQKEFLASLILMAFPLEIDDPYFVRGSS